MHLALEPAAAIARWLRRDERRVLVAKPQVTRWFAMGVPQGRIRELPRAQGRMVVHCRQGSIWITHDGEPQDVVLRPNESYTVDSDQRMTAFAMHGDCGLELQVDA